MKIIFPFLICVLEKFSCLNFVFNHNELIITMVLTRAKCGLYFQVQFVPVRSVLSF